MCEGDGKSCAYMTCSECGVGKLYDYLPPVKDLEYQGVLSWHRWTTKKVTGGTKMTSTARKEVTRKVLERRDGTIKQLLEELLHAVGFLSKHQAT